MPAVKHPVPWSWLVPTGIALAALLPLGRLMFAWESSRSRGTEAIDALTFPVIPAVLLVLLGALAIAAWTVAENHSRAFNRERAALERTNAALSEAKAEAEAKAAQLEGMLANMSDGVSLIDGEMRLRQWNALFPVRTGVPKELLHLGMTMEEILTIQAQLGEFGPVDVEREVARRMVRVRDPTPFGSIERARPNGMTIELRRSLMPDGGFVTLYADITARKKAEAAERHAREAADAAIAAKAEFVATVAHEVRSPLAAVIGSLDLLAGSGLGPAQQKWVQAARGAGNALSRLIADILDMARMDAGQFRLIPEDFALAAALESVVDMFRSQAVTRGLVLVLAVDRDVPEWLHADPGRLRQVLLNFIGNAVKFSARGTITLVVTRKGHELVFAVTDPGPRIAEADRERLFRPFQRLESAVASGISGSGLGLAISARLAHLMGGAIGCEAAGNGNRFWLSIPLTPAVAPTLAAALDAAPEAPAKPIPRTRVLLVEDVPANQLILATTLRRAGHMVDIAPSGEAAMAALERVPYDLAFLDLHLPGIDGLETARRIRALAGAAATMPLVALTATVSGNAWPQCLAAGMNDMLGKPAPAGVLQEMLAIRLVPRQRSVSPPEVAAAGLDSERVATLSRELPPGMFAKLARECLADIALRLPILRSALAEGRSAEVAETAHSIAGTAATYGLSALARLARDVSARPELARAEALEAAFAEGAAALTARLTTRA